MTRMPTARRVEVRSMRERAITLLSLWGWEPVEYGAPGQYEPAPVEARLLHRGELRCLSSIATGAWHIWPIGADMLWAWQPCEWVRFNTWTLKRCIKLIEERDAIQSNPQ